MNTITNGRDSAGHMVPEQEKERERARNGERERTLFGQMRLQNVPATLSLCSWKGIPDLLKPLQEQESNLSSLISPASVLLSSPPLPPSLSSIHHPLVSALYRPVECWTSEAKRPWFGSKVGQLPSQRRSVVSIDSQQGVILCMLTSIGWCHVGNHTDHQKTTAVQKDRPQHRGRFPLWSPSQLNTIHKNPWNPQYSQYIIEKDTWCGFCRIPDPKFVSIFEQKSEVNNPVINHQKPTTLFLVQKHDYAAFRF